MEAPTGLVAPSRCERQRKVPDQERQKSASRWSCGDSRRTTCGKGEEQAKSQKDIDDVNRQWRSGEDQGQEVAAVS